MLDYDLTRNSASVTQVSNRLAGHVEIQTAFSRAHLDVNNAISIAGCGSLYCVSPVLHGVHDGDHESDQAFPT